MTVPETMNAMAKEIAELRAEIARMRQDHGEMRLVLESQDLRLKKFHDDNKRLREAIQGFHDSWLRYPNYVEEYESAVQKLFKIAREEK